MFDSETPINLQHQCKKLGRTMRGFHPQKEPFRYKLEISKVSLNTEGRLLDIFNGQKMLYVEPVNNPLIGAGSDAVMVGINNNLLSDYGFNMSNSPNESALMIQNNKGSS